jgi:serine/threonine protein kinase
VVADPFGLIGQLLDGQYRVDALVGEGGFSAVYRGTLVGLGEPVAIKCLKLTGALAQGTAVVDTFVKRFRDEGRILYRLGQGNLNIVRCIASGTIIAPATGALLPYMVLEWLEGQTLEADLGARAGRPRTFAETMSLLEPVFDAMAHAHSLGVIHRDLSATNIFLAKQRGSDAMSAKVLDFGVAKVISDDLELGPRTATLGQIRIFSPAYAAPEQFDSRLAPPAAYTDVYSLALIAVELLTGRLVRTAESLGEVMKHALDPSAPRTPRALGVNVPDAVEQVLARALSIEASKRQKDAGELGRELRGAQSVTFGRPPMDLGTTARSGPIEPDLGALRSTVKMPQSTSGGVPAPQLFLAPAMRPAPGTPPPAASGSFAELAQTRADPTQMRVAPPSAPQQTRPPLSTRSAARAQWLVGLLVFIVVLAAGGAALKLWLLR